CAWATAARVAIAAAAARRRIPERIRKLMNGRDCSKSRFARPEEQPRPVYWNAAARRLLRGGRDGLLKPARQRRVERFQIGTRRGGAHGVLPFLVQIADGQIGADANKDRDLG